MRHYCCWVRICAGQRIEGARVVAKKPKKNQDKAKTTDSEVDAAVDAVQEDQTSGADTSTVDQDTLTAGADTVAAQDEAATLADNTDMLEGGDGTGADARDTDTAEGEDLASSEVDNAVDGDAEIRDVTDTEAEAAPKPAPEVIRETVVEHKAGFVPTALGGVIAAGIGFVAAQYYDSTVETEGNAEVAALQETVASQSGLIEDLNAKLDAVPTVPEVVLSSVEASIGDTQAQIEALVGQIDGLNAKVAEIAARPVVEETGEVTVDLSGVQSQIDALSSALDVQKGTLAQMIEQVQTEKASAEEIARQTVARSAVTRILVALDSGAPFADALADVEANSDVALPEALAQSASEGIPTNAVLAEIYPDAARDALAAARSDTPAAGVGGFLSKQLGVRSVAPREGDDPDAVLSRMEAAVRDGRLSDALAEMDALPDAAKAPLAEWAAQAKLRLSAIADAEALANSLNSQ